MYLCDIHNLISYYYVILGFTTFDSFTTLQKKRDQLRSTGRLVGESAYEPSPKAYPLLPFVSPG